MKTDHGSDIPEDELARAYGQNTCPRCGSSMTDMRSTSASQFTLAARGTCIRNGERWAGFVCNKGAREKTAR